MKNERYETYVVRIREDETTWRAQVTQVSSGESHFFTNLAQLCLFWHNENIFRPQVKGEDQHEVE